MRKRLLMMLGIAAVLLSLSTFAVAPLLLAKEGPKIPFVGMSMTYYSNAMGSFVSRQVVVLKHYPETNSVLLRDGPDWMKVNVATREVFWATGWSADKVPFAVEFWIPTNIKMGSRVKILWLEAEVIGSAVLSVEGKRVECWQLYSSGTENPDGNLYYTQTTWYYEKSTGLWIAASWVEWDETGEPLANWGGHLASTNVPLP